MEIVNFGSLNIDYVYSVDHFVQAGETESSIKRTIFPGGKGLNQSIAIARAGSKVFHAGSIGLNDGLFLKDLLKSSGVEVDYVRSLDSPSGHTIIQVDATGNNCIILYPGTNAKQDEPFVKEVMKNFGSDDYIVLQNEINNLNLIIEIAHKKNMIICLNPSPYDKKIESLNLNYVNYFFLNEIEGMAMCKKQNLSNDEMIQTLRAKYPLAKFVLTLGTDGVVYFDNKNFYSHGVYDVDVVDTTAAGDTFTGYFISMISNGTSIPVALKYASVAASIAVSRNGASVSVPTLEEVKNSTLKLKI